jgi:hypothetical protein
MRKQQPTESEEDVAPLYFNDGCVRHRDYVYVAGKLASEENETYAFARMSFYKAPDWGSHDLEWEVVSVTYDPEGDALYALSPEGNVSIVTDDNYEEAIPDGAKYGGLSQIKHIDGAIYVCGFRGQVYQRSPRGWTHIDRGIFEAKLKAKALHLNSIDGTSANDIYVVGFGGRILHYDGSTWTELSSPTNLHLERVHCAAPGEIYACGNNGTFLKITPQGIENHSIEVEDHFWGLTSFQGKVYLATLKGLYVFDGKTVEELDTGLEPPIGGYRLDARDGQLWSFGVDDLAFFDGKTWTRVIHPDNV